MDFFKLIKKKIFQEYHQSVKNLDPDPKISNTLCVEVFLSTFFLMHLFHKILNGKASSVDSDQTAP